MRVHMFIVRHGQTLFNLVDRPQGLCDSALTEKGIEQGKTAGHALRNVWFHHAYTSPMERCVDTSDLILSGRKMSARILDDLREQDFGIFEGTDDSQLKKQFQKMCMTADFSSGNCEPFDEVRNRFLRALNEIVKECDHDDNVLVVSHGAVMMSSLPLFGIDLETYTKERMKAGKSPLPNAGIMEVLYEDGKYTIVQLPSAPEDFIPSTVDKTVHFHYVRHGETMFNKEDRFQGWCDSPLTQRGIEQAKKAHDYLADVPFAFAACSTALRTRNTAKMILEGRDIPLLPLKGLKEINVGTYEAWKYTPNREILQPRSRQVKWKDAGGEDYEDIASRMRDTFALLYSRAKDGEHVLTVSHGGYYLILLTVLFGIDRNAYRDRCEKEGRSPMPNCGVFEFDVCDGGYVFSDYMKDIEK